MRYSNYLLCALLGVPALASCAIGGGSDDNEIDQGLELSSINVQMQGLLQFGTRVFAENPTTQLDAGRFHGYAFNGKAHANMLVTASSAACGLQLHLFRPEDGAGNRGGHIANSATPTTTTTTPGPYGSTTTSTCGPAAIHIVLPTDGEYLIVVSRDSGAGHYELTLTCHDTTCGPSGDMTFQSTRIRQAEIDSGAFTPDALFEVGDFLFETVYRVEDGMGNALAGSPAGTSPRPNFRGVHLGGFGAPEAQSCITCHNVGGDDGAGDLDRNIFQIGDGLTKPSGLPRNPPLVLGLGLRQQIGIEMTNELQNQVANAKQMAARDGFTVTRHLASNGVGFGTITVTPQGVVDTSGVIGVDTDLVVKPFGWKGREASLRRFIEGGLRVHFGMQTGPSIAKHCATPDAPTFGTGVCTDPDGDGVVEEVTEGQLTALAVYMGLLETPVRVPAADLSRLAAGTQLFARVGCASCHTPAMRLASPRHVEPADTTGGGGITLNFATDMKAPHPSVNSDGSMTVELWSDFKRHDMGRSLADNKPFKNIAASEFITTPLWGVATSAPYMHDGRAPTLHDAILAHDGDAASSRAAYSVLPPDEQRKLVELLATLGRAD